MLDFLDFLLDFIRTDLMIGFGWYSIIFFTLKWCSVKKEFLVNLDKYACKAVVFLGILFMAVWIILVFSNYLIMMDVAEKIEFRQRITGPYAFAFFLQPIFWLLLTQSLRIHVVRRFLLLRLFICLCFILTFERFVIIVTSFHRDYLPSSWTMYTPVGIPWWEFALAFFVKMIEFLLIAVLFKYSTQAFSKYKTKSN